MGLYRWLSLFVFRPLSEKQKKDNLCDLCVSAVKYLTVEFIIFQKY